MAVGNEQTNKKHVWPSCEGIQACIFKVCVSRKSKIASGGFLNWRAKNVIDNFRLAWKMWHFGSLGIY